MSKNYTTNAGGQLLSLNFMKKQKYVNIIFYINIGLTQLNNQEYSEALEDKLQQHVE